MGGCLVACKFGLCDCPEAGDAGQRKFRVDFQVRAVKIQ
jgi:hypothetical protein